jgi:hypothetical protein
VAKEAKTQTSDSASSPQRFLGRLVRSETLRRWSPDLVKRLARRLVDPDTLRRELAELQDPYGEVEVVSTYPARVDVRLGIVKEINNRHKRYVGACRDMGVPYRIMDLSGPDWLDALADSDCEAYLVWPSADVTVRKQMFDERLRIMVEELGLIIHPGLRELWIYESKRRMYYWLKANGFEAPRTWVFYSMSDALEFARRCPLPIVYKSDFGSGTSGVTILRARNSLARHIRRCFRKGLVRDQSDARDLQWGTVLLQEYLSDIREWRMIRIGDSSFGYEKVKVGDFHTGSHRWAFGRPPDELLNLLKAVSERGSFSSIDLDVFVTPEGRLLINELQSVFGMGHPWEMCVVDGKPGRMLFETGSGSWRFEAGSFCDHWMCNLRVARLLQMLGREMPVSSADRDPDPAPGRPRVIALGD